MHIKCAKCHDVEVTKLVFGLVIRSNEHLLLKECGLKLFFIKYEKYWN